MRRFILAAFLALFCLPASAELLVNQLIGFGVGGGPVSRTFIDSYEDTTDVATTYTFNVSLGSPGSYRQTVVAATQGGTNRTVSSAKVHVPTTAADPAGTTMTLCTGAKGSSSSTSTEFWYAPTSTGTAGQVVVVWSGASTRGGLHVWALYNASSTHHAGTVDNSSTYSQSLAVPSNGAIMASISGINATGYNWTAPTPEHSDETVEATTEYSAASAEYASGSSVTVSVAPNGIDSNVMAACSFGPR